MQSVELTAKAGILHVCGGDPNRTASDNATKGYSPRVWR
ncbi:hypothetical protein HYQ59_1102 [Lactobacillus crispatus]|nr:hypothetical protein [Lactobacillus crispatus]